MHRSAEVLAIEVLAESTAVDVELGRTLRGRRWRHNISKHDHRKVAVRARIGSKRPSHGAADSHKCLLRKQQNLQLYEHPKQGVQHLGSICHGGRNC